MSLKDKRILITGATRGIGAEIARTCAKDGAIIGVIGKTDTPHPKLEGTIQSVVEEINTLGGTGIPLKTDIRHDDEIINAITTFTDKTGGIDILVNNASAIKLGNELSTKDYDLIMDINSRGTYMMSQHCIPYLLKSEDPHILTLSPPLNLESKWIQKTIPYTLSKFGMSLITLGLSQSLKQIHVNSLWPKTTIATAAVQYNLPPDVYEASRHPKIMADAAYTILTDNSNENTGHFYIDEVLLQEKNKFNANDYAINPDKTPIEDIYIT